MRKCKAGRRRKCVLMCSEKKLGVFSGKKFWKGKLSGLSMQSIWKDSRLSTNRTSTTPFIHP